MHSIIFYGSYLVFPFLAFVSWFACRELAWIKSEKLFLTFIILFFVGSALFIYARFIEPQIILTKTHRIKTGFEAKIVILSDIHLGVYKDKHFLERIIEKTNAIEDVDAVLIPGDLTYWPQTPVDELFAPLRDLKYPSYAVLGNHDNENLDTKTKNALITVLRDNGVALIQNEATRIPNTDIILLGLGDNWAKEDDISLIDNYTEEDNLIV
ncbi:metallophosphoesterase, partial [Patescibacteria group bacterium]|nr:metallophosphoesterase [Patescibacteria group bacterium]